MSKIKRIDRIVRFNVNYTYDAFNPVIGLSEPSHRTTEIFNGHIEETYQEHPSDWLRRIGKL